MRKRPSKRQTFATKSDSGTSRQPNPYGMAFLTAALAGLFSVVGGYFAAGFQAQYAVTQKQLEFRVRAYESFLEKTDRAKTPRISQILSIGTMADELVTDGEIQTFENQISELLKKHDAQDLYWQLNGDFNILRLHGSTQVIKTYNDILKALLLRDDEINWTDYPPEVAAFQKRWKISQEKGIVYSWEEKVSGAERLKIVTLAKLTQELIQQMRLEIQRASI
jgi:hypothetical protein